MDRFGANDEHQEAAGRLSPGSSGTERRAVAVPFVLLSQGRTGSSYLIEALKRHPDILAEGEHLVGLRHTGAQAQLRWTRWFLGPQHDHGCRAVGFKTKLSDALDREGFAQLLRAVGAKILLGQRRNLVKMVVSWIHSEQIFQATGAWNLYRNSSPRGPLAIDIHDFKSKLRQVEQGTERLGRFAENLQLPLLSVTYEQLLTDRLGTLERVVAFLGVPQKQLTGQCIKSTSDNLREALANFDELRSHFVGTLYEPMFDEVLVPQGKHDE